MDYQLHVYPSSEKDLNNIKSDNAEKQIKLLKDNKIKNVYKKRFAAAVKKYNERAISGRLIEDYYKSILVSNIPEVYKMTVVIHYNYGDKNDLAIIQKVFTEFQKSLEKEEFFALVAAYQMNYDEFKELQLFFVPVSTGYNIELSVRNDLIDIVRKKHDIKKNLDIIRAMSMFVEDMETLFKSICGDKILSQKELDEIAHKIVKTDPMSVHFIEVNALKTQMNNLQRINSENQTLENAVEKEKERIESDLDWIKVAADQIYKAEEERIEEERRAEEERRKAEAARLAAEAKWREEERLKEEARRREAERLAEQTRRNIDFRRQMMMKAEEEERRKATRRQISREEFAALIDAHIRWQEAYGINEDSNLEEIDPVAFEDPRRMNLKGADLREIALSEELTLLGAQLEDCELFNCEISGVVALSTFSKCVLTHSHVENLEINKCNIEGLQANETSFKASNISESTVMNSYFKSSLITDCISTLTTSYLKCNFYGATFTNCDMKKNVFVNSEFISATFDSCDMRDTVFQICKIAGMNKTNSLFRGAKVNYSSMN